MFDFNKLVTMRKGLTVERMHTIAHHQSYNNGFHSANAALIVIELCTKNERDWKFLVQYMLMHDIPEYGIGDLPATAKRANPLLRVEAIKAEKNWLDNNDIKLPNLTDFEHRICKVADYTELGMFCIDELNMGNMYVTHVLNNVIEYLKGYSDVKGVTDIISNFRDFTNVI